MLFTVKYCVFHFRSFYHFSYNINRKQLNDPKVCFFDLYWKCLVEDGILQHINSSTKYANSFRSCCMHSFVNINISFYYFPPDRKSSKWFLFDCTFLKNICVQTVEKLVNNPLSNITLFSSFGWPILSMLLKETTKKKTNIANMFTILKYFVVLCIWFRI